MILNHPQSLNRYSYVLGNPTNDDDPTGAEDTEDLTNEDSADQFGGGGALDASVPSSPDDGTQNASDTKYTTTTDVCVTATPDIPYLSSGSQIPNISLNISNPDISLNADQPDPIDLPSYNFTTPSTTTNPNPGCGSAVAETAVGAVAVGGEAALIFAVGPELLTVASEAVAEEAAESGPIGGAVAIAHFGEALGTATIAPVLITAHGINGIASNCF